MSQPLRPAAAPQRHLWFAALLPFLPEQLRVSRLERLHRLGLPRPGARRVESRT